MNVNLQNKDLTSYCIQKTYMALSCRNLLRLTFAQFVINNIMLKSRSMTECSIRCADAVDYNILSRAE